MGVRRDPSLEHVGRLDGRPQFLGAVLLGAGRVTHGDDATGRADLDEIGAVLALVADGADQRALFRIAFSFDRHRRATYL